MGSVSLREAQSDAHAVPYDRYAIGLHHLAFSASSRSVVDERAQWLRDERAQIESGPEEYGYTPGYYAVFFYDPDGIKLEIVHRSHPSRKAADDGRPEHARRSRVDGHSHAHDHPHDHDHAHGPGGHTHGLVHESIKRSREGLRAVGLALVVLGATAILQLVVFVASGSVALLADLIHNFGDAATAIPLAIAFALRSARAERWAGLAVVLAIFVSACVAGYEAIDRLLNPHEPEYLAALALAGVVGFAGNWWAALIRTRAGRRLDSPALVADGAHARADAYVSLAVVASAGAVAAGAAIADPLIGLGITLVILKITLDSWRTVRGSAAA